MEATKINTYQNTDWQEKGKQLPNTWARDRYDYSTGWTLQKVIDVSSVLKLVRRSFPYAKKTHIFLSFQMYHQKNMILSLFLYYMKDRRRRPEEGEWEPIKIPHRNLAYVSKSTWNPSLLARPRLPSYRQAIDLRNRARTSNSRALWTGNSRVILGIHLH
jgi:hypothetical protein